MALKDPRSLDLLNSITGIIAGPDPMRRAQSEAYLGQASQGYATAATTRRELEWREKLVDAMLNPNTRGALAYAAGAGGDVGRNAPALIAGQGVLPDADITPEIASSLSSVMGVQRMSETPVGFEDALANEIRRANISAGATLGAARIGASSREAIAAADRAAAAAGGGKPVYSHTDQMVANLVAGMMTPDSDGGSAITPGEQAIIDAARENLVRFAPVKGDYAMLPQGDRAPAAGVQLGTVESADNAADNAAAAARAADDRELDRWLAESKNQAALELERLRQSGNSSDPATLASTNRVLSGFLSGFEDTKVDPQMIPQVTSYYFSRLEDGASVGQVLGEIEAAITGTGKKEGFFGDDAPFRFNPPAGAAPATDAIPADGHAEGARAQGPDGRVYVVRGGMWVPE